MLNTNITTFLFWGVEGTVLITLKTAREYILYSNLIADMGDGLKKKGVRREIMPAMLL